MTIILGFFKNQAANILTFINMIIGLFSIKYAIQGYYTISSILIIVAALTDRFDGMVARKLNTVSVLGKYLDSNSDLISFGVAPGLLIYLSVIDKFGMFGLIVSFLFIIGGAFRLARYNAVEFTGYYIGIPITIAGAILALSVFAIPYIPPLVYIFFTLLLAYLMVCNHSIKKV
jgi:CDP-diacylglycerol---serine O-phosphatidyltransferase